MQDKVLKKYIKFALILLVLGIINEIVSHSIALFNTYTVHDILLHTLVNVTIKCAICATYITASIEHLTLHFCLIYMIAVHGIQKVDMT